VPLLFTGTAIPNVLRLLDSMDAIEFITNLPFKASTMYFKLDKFFLSGWAGFKLLGVLTMSLISAGLILDPLSDTSKIK
jgi:hypothetical protein